MDESLSADQRRAFRAVLEDDSDVFLTGPAGTGKSYLIKHLLDAAEARGRSVLVTASTGAAAAGLPRGQTVHSLGLFKEQPSLQHATALAHRKRKYWATPCSPGAKLLLIVDEVSMLSARYFEQLAAFVSVLTSGSVNLGRGKPFGPHVQLLLVGDFLQLPPVTKRHHAAADARTYAFETSAWKNQITRHCVLRRNFRQAGDDRKHEAFRMLLARLRTGRLTGADLQWLRSRERDEPNDSSGVVVLATVTKHVQQRNDAALERLRDAPGHVYAAVAGVLPRKHVRDASGRVVSTFQYSKMGALDGGDTARARLLKHAQVPDRLEIKKGMRVMLTQNVCVPDLVNGSSGTVVDFQCQGNVNDNDAEEEKDEKDEKEEEGGKSIWLPVVRFDNPTEALAHQDVVVEPWMWTGGTAVTRTGKAKKPTAAADATNRKSPKTWTTHVLAACQLPLVHAAAISGHKAQGASLGSVFADLSRCFAPGQAYVMLSRCTNPDRLWIQRGSLRNAQDIQRVCPRALDFMRSVEDEQPADENDDEAAASSSNRDGFGERAPATVPPSRKRKAIDTQQPQQQQPLEKTRKKKKKKGKKKKKKKRKKKSNAGSSEESEDTVSFAHEAWDADIL